MAKTSKRSSTRTAAFKTLDPLRPLLVMIEIDCRHYTFQQEPEIQSSSSRMAITSRRRLSPFGSLRSYCQEASSSWTLFLHRESTEPSELWNQAEIEKLSEMQGVFSFVMDAGCFGAEIDGEKIAKPFQILTAWMRCCILA